jgi:glycosyltransferase involved in cell wall biosynthesis
VNIPALVRALGRHGVDVTLVTTNDDPHRRLEVPLDRPVTSDDVTYIFHNSWPIAGRYGFAPSLIRTLRTILSRCDLVHIHWLYNFACVAAARASLAAGVPFIIQPRGSLDPYIRRKNSLAKRVYLSTIGRPLLTRAGAVIFTAEQERERAEYRRHQPEWIVSNGIDWSVYERLPERGTFRAAFPAVRGPFLLFLGRLSRQKGLDLLLPAFAQLAREHPDLQLVLAGPDHEGYAANVRTLAASLGVDQRIVFTGLLTGALKLGAYVDAELFVLPSYMENFGGVIIEALACGLPVVISDQVHIHRELRSAGAAVVTQCTVDSVAAGIRAVLTDPAARNRMSTTGRNLVCNHYTWDSSVPKLVAHYRELLAGTSPL